MGQPDEARGGEPPLYAEDLAGLLADLVRKAPGWSEAVVGDAHEHRRDGAFFNFGYRGQEFVITVRLERGL